MIDHFDQEDKQVRKKGAGRRESAEGHPAWPNRACQPPMQVALAALTGCAAELVGGDTLHRVLQIGVATKVRWQDLAVGYRCPPDHAPSTGMHALARSSNLPAGLPCHAGWPHRGCEEEAQREAGGAGCPDRRRGKPNMRASLAPCALLSSQLALCCPVCG